MNIAKEMLKGEIIKSYDEVLVKLKEGDKVIAKFSDEDNETPSTIRIKNEEVVLWFDCSDTNSFLRCTVHPGSFDTDRDCFYIEYIKKI